MSANTAKPVRRSIVGRYDYIVEPVLLREETQLRTKEERRHHKRLMNDLEGDLLDWGASDTHNLLANATRHELIKIIKMQKNEMNRQISVLNGLDPQSQEAYYLHEEISARSKIRERATKDLIEMNALEQKNWQDWSEMFAIGLLVLERVLVRSGWI